MAAHSSILALRTDDESRALHYSKRDCTGQKVHLGVCITSYCHELYLKGSVLVSGEP